MRRFVLPTLAALAGLAFLISGPLAAAEPKLESEDEKTIYALGVAVSRSLGQFGLSDAETDVMLAGLRDALAGKEPRVDLMAYGPKIDALAKNRVGALAEKEKLASADFLKEAAAAKGAVKTDSGMVFLETQAGTGMSPTPENVVKVHYHGTLRDGTVFDSSVDRGEPATFGLNRVIPCWTEALQKMRVGGKATITCPSDTAYGDKGSRAIKPGASLRFDVELISIEN